MMHSTKSESDITSLTASSPSRSPKRPIYYVQSPSRDSHDGDPPNSYKSSSVQPSPMDSPAHDSSSIGRHSRNSSASRFSGIFRSSSGRKNGRKGRANDKGWPECKVILEEGSYDEMEDKAFMRRCQALLAVFSFVVLFTVFCLIIWGASRPYKAGIAVKRLEIHNFYVGEGSDFSGVPTKLLTLNATLRINVYNPATLFGIHVSSTPINLIYSEIAIATGQMKKYYQPRKSHRPVTVVLEGKRVPLYGAGSSMEASERGGQVPVVLRFEIRSRGNVVGKLVRTMHKKQISCPLVLDVGTNTPVKFKTGSCIYK